MGSANKPRNAAGRVRKAHKLDTGHTESRHTMKLAGLVLRVTFCSILLACICSEETSATASGAQETTWDEITVPNSAAVAAPALDSPTKISLSAMKSQQQATVTPLARTE